MLSAARAVSPNTIAISSRPWRRFPVPSGSSWCRGLATVTARRCRRACGNSSAQGNRLSYSLTALRAAVMLGPFDFVFCGHLHLAPLAALLAAGLGVPLWLQLHGYEAWDDMKRAERWSAERAKLITSVSRYTRRRFLSLAGVDPSCVRVLPNTVDGGFSPGAKSDALLDRFCLRGKRVLLTVSRLDPNERRKGHDRVIKALPAIVSRSAQRRLSHRRRMGRIGRRLEALAQSLGVANNVVFAGSVAPDELPQLYRLADLFVMPSAQEGFGIVFLEAAASGLRAIGGNVDGSIDALADGAIGTAIDPNDFRSAGARRQERSRWRRSGPVRRRPLPLREFFRPRSRLGEWHVCCPARPVRRHERARRRQSADRSFARVGGGHAPTSAPPSSSSSRA